MALVQTPLWSPSAELTARGLLPTPGFKVAAGGGSGGGSHSLGICFLAPGLYPLHVYGVGIVPAAEHGDSSSRQTSGGAGVSTHALHVVVQ